MYTLKYSNNAERAFMNLDRQVGKRIYHALETIRADPHTYVEEMKHPQRSEPLYKYRVGDYRILMTLFDEKLIILVVDAGPRKTIYKKYGGKG